MAEQQTMDGRATVGAATRLSLGEWVLVGIIAYFVILKLIFALLAFPTSDEAYYWTWGQHPALSYFDHPPLNGWLLGLSGTIFGHNVFALRWLTFVCLAVNLWTFAAIAKRVMGEDWRPVFLKSSVVYLASPLFGFFGAVAFHDYLLVTFVLTSGALFIAYFADVEREGRGRTGQLLAAGLLLGLSGLTKYNAAYLGVAVAAIVVTRPKLRPLLLKWPIYASAAIAIACQAPVIVWNLQNELASFRFQLGSRHGETGFTGIDVKRMKLVAAEFLALCSPFLFPMIVKFFWARQPTTFERVGKTLAIWMFWMSTLVVLYIANFSWVLWWWNITAFVLVFPFVGRYTDRIVLPLHIVWGLLINTFLTVSFAIVPLGHLVGNFAKTETDLAYDWDRIAAVVTRAADENDAGFVAANRYQSAGLLSFALGGRDVRELSPRITSFDAWFDDEAHAGEDAIVFVDGRDDVRFWQTQFAGFESLGSITAERFGIPLETYELYLGRDYRPTGE